MTLYKLLQFASFIRIWTSIWSCKGKFISLFDALYSLFLLFDLISLFCLHWRQECIQKDTFCQLQLASLLEFYINPDTFHSGLDHWFRAINWWSQSDWMNSSNSKLSAHKITEYVCVREQILLFPEFIHDCRLEFVNLLLLLRC